MNDKELAQKIATERARMTPTKFDSRLAGWYKGNQNRLISFAGGEDEAKKYMAALVHVASRTPKLVQVAETDAGLASLGDCLMQSSELNLFPGAMQQCAYVPFKDKKRGLIAVFMIMYQGMVALAFRSGHVRDIQCDVVYGSDSFEFEKGTEKFLRHVPDLSKSRLESPRECVYCVIGTEGGHNIEVKGMDWVHGIMKRSPAARYGESPWKSDFDEMGRKSILKYTCKNVPKSAQLARGIELDNATDRPDLVKAKIVDLNIVSSEEEVNPKPEGD